MKRARWLPPLVLPARLTEEPVNEMAVPVLEAARLADTSEQNLHQAINRGALPAYEWAGRRMILLDDLAESPAGRKQADRLAAERHRAGWAEYRHATIPQPDCWANGFEDCHLCAEQVPAEEPVDQPARPPS